MHIDGARIPHLMPGSKLHLMPMGTPGGVGSEFEASLLRYIAAKGSVCVDGVSLTVNAVDGEGFEVALVPHTLAHTAFGATSIGDGVNLEVDLVARYVERLLQERDA